MKPWQWRSTWNRCPFFVWETELGVTNDFCSGVQVESDVLVGEEGGVTREGEKVQAKVASVV